MNTFVIVIVPVGLIIFLYVAHKVIDAWLTILRKVVRKHPEQRLLLKMGGDSHCNIVYGLLPLVLFLIQTHYYRIYIYRGR